jgi:GNAT superfamily N-acetyltransferase
MSTDEEKINLAIWKVLKESNCFNTITVGEDTIYIIAVSLLTEAKCGSDGLYFVHASSEHTPDKQEKQGDPVYSTAYVLPNNPDNADDNYTNINYIDVPKAYRGRRIASKLLTAIESWYREEQRKCPLIRLDNDTDINPVSGLPSSLYEKAGYHYINGYIEYNFRGQTINVPNGCEMEMVLKGGNHTSGCYYKTNFENTSSVSKEDEKKAEELVCNRGIKKKRLHLRHIESKNIIGNLEDCVKTRGQLNKTTTQAQAQFQFSRRKYFKKSKRKSNRKSVRKSKPKSNRKSVRKSKRKSNRKSRR